MKSVRIFTLAAVFVLSSYASFAQEGDNRIGLEENFDTVDKWQKLDFPRETAPLKEAKSVNGVGVFVTHPSPLRSAQKRTRWLDGMTPYDAYSNIVMKFGELDLDKYRYLVMKIDEKGTPTSVIVNHVDLPIAYTTGIRAVDLKQHGLTGKQPVEFRIQFVNGGQTVKLDWFRFVSKLTDEEKAGLIPEGIAVHEENLTHHPTQGLDAVMKRVHRPRKEKIPVEKLCFRDVETGVVIWRMTGLQKGSSMVSDSVRTIFSGNGSQMIILGRKEGPCFYSFAKDEFIPNVRAAIGRFSSRDPDVFWAVEYMRGRTGIRFYRMNVRTGASDLLAEVPFKNFGIRASIVDVGYSAKNDVIAVGLRETPYCFIFDPTKPAAKRVKTIKLPMRLKGMELSPDGKKLSWARCYWYEGWQMDLESGEITRGMRLGGSHAGSGGATRLAGYQGLILAYPMGMNDWKAGDKVKILLNYRKGWHTDYGHLSPDGLAYIANGSAGDMKNKLIMAGTKEPGTIFQIAFQNTSRNDWGCNTVVKSSPDYTKLTWVSNIWGYNAVCVTYTRRPEPPTKVTGKREGPIVTVNWQRSSNTGTWTAPAELMGYNVYRSKNQGPFVALNRAPITGTSYRDDVGSRAGTFRYVVVAQEHSGLEGNPSNEFMCLPEGPHPGGPPVQKLHFEMELATLAPPARQVFSGWTSGWRYVRVTKQRETEKTAAIRLDITPQFVADHTMWLRVRAEDKPGKWTVSLDGKVLGSVAVDGKQWKWARLDKPVCVGTQNHIIRLSSADDGLAIDKIILSNDRNYVPKTLDDRFRVPPKGLQFLIDKEVTKSSAHIAWWNPKAESDLDYYSVYVGDNHDLPTDQAHLIGSTKKNEFYDWGLKPGTTYFYKVVPVNRRGLVGPYACIRVTTKPLKRKVLLAFSIDQAKLDVRLKKQPRAGKRYAWLPDQGEEHKKDAPADVTWEFDLPVRDDYTIWCQYAPADYSSRFLRVPVKLDDMGGGKAYWRMRSPYRDMSGSNYRVWKEDLWFTDKVTIYTWPRPKTLFRLDAGKHKLTLSMSPEMREFHNKIGWIWITNDPSYRPPGWDPLADFTKSKVVRK